jgi:uncharacterized RDD family membrane protein YckC
MESYQQPYQQDILTNLEVDLVQASGGKRFANYLIDVAVYYLLVIIAGIIIALAYPENIDRLEYQSSGFNMIGDRLLSLFLYGLYMSLTEAIFKGKTLGKLITGTRAVNEDGSNISFKTAFLRGLSRAVPFEAFSALGSPSYPWHDKWTNTYVIDEKRSRLIL